MTQPTKAEFLKVSDLVTALDKRLELVQKEAELAAARADKAGQEVDKLREELQAARIENAVLKQQLADHIAQYQEGDRRRWTLTTVLIGAVLSLASGLIVALTKK